MFISQFASFFASVDGSSLDPLGGPLDTLFHSIENPLVHQIPSLVAISKPRDREKDGSVRGAGYWVGRGERLVDGRAIEELDSWFPLLEPAPVFVPLNGLKNLVAFDCFSCLIRSTRC